MTDQATTISVRERRFPHGFERGLICLAASLVLMLSCVGLALAQSSSTFDEEEADPIKLFERGQDAHSKGDLKRALELYEQALSVRPEFPEAEFQRAIVLLSYNRLPEAEASFRRVVELRPNWAIGYAFLGDALARQNRPQDAEPVLLKALSLEPTNSNALLILADIRLNSNSSRATLVELAGILRAGTANGVKSPAAVWIARGFTERRIGDNASAIASFSTAIGLEPNNLEALDARSETYAIVGDREHALEGANAALRILATDRRALLLLARIYGDTGKCEEASQALNRLDESSQALAETKAVREHLALACATGSEERETLEHALESDPKNGRILNRLSTLYRTDDPQKALEYGRRAVESESTNPDYATTYGAALVQARRFAEAAALLSKVISVAPDNYVARANLATSFYELKIYDRAIAQYEWILSAKPDAIAAYFFIATAHDSRGEYEAALASYEKFLARADTTQYQVEIERVKLRLPMLRDQIRLKQGKKK